jgi:hypothetical protein
MNNYALVFDVAPFAEDTESLLLDFGLGVTVQGGLWAAETVDAGSNGVEAAKTAFRQLRQLGVTVNRLRLELVNMAAIARRANVSRTTVGNWVRETTPKAGIPAPFTITEAGPLWSWSDVNEWLRCRSGEHAFESWCTPSPSEVEDFNHWLRNLPKPDVLMVNPSPAVEPIRRHYAGSVVMIDGTAESWLSKK